MMNIVEKDHWLLPVADEVQKRHERFVTRLEMIERRYGGLTAFASAYEFFGLNYDSVRKGWWYREWAPGAHYLSLFGDFNGWDRYANPLENDGNGIWSVFLPDSEYKDRFVHGSLFKVLVQSSIGEQERIPVYANRVVQDEASKDFTAQLWCPKEKYVFKHNARIPEGEPLLIYEAHVGMGQEKEGVGSYSEFIDNVLPRVKDGGYNALQIMAIAEHPYYGSFGYHVSNFFAASSRFGTPDELKRLVDTAHGLGIVVIMDLVHSHTVKNVREGINLFDGTDGQYLKTGNEGVHPQWDSRLFNYGKIETLQLLLSNVKYWLDEFHFDGFRFDGVTSMIYRNHGLGQDFTNYSDYYNLNQDGDAICYLTLANKLIHEVKPDAITIAEEMSGLPELAVPFSDGGIGFDYRLAMGIPDFWIRYIKEVRDEDWKAGHIFYEMTNRRAGEKTISYAESHDQALVGDKTIIFRLIDSDMYWHMKKGDETLLVNRGIALHKMIRLITLATINGGYLNFMGNEFGHPEWIDFPREGNGWSYKYARRQWSLEDREDLHYADLARFDKAMLSLITEERKFSESLIEKIWDNEGDQLVAFKRKDLIFIFNFNPNKSFADYGILVKKGTYDVVLDTDSVEFGGFGFSDNSVEHRTMPSHLKNKEWLKVYIPARSALVLRKIE